MNRIYFHQQKESSYTPLRVGIGLLSEQSLADHLCKKIYTTRTHVLNGKYIVVEGSLFKSRFVLPEIRFQVLTKYILYLKEQMIAPIYGKRIDFLHKISIDTLSKDGLSYPELDLGYRGATYDDLVETMYYLNSKLQDQPKSLYVHVLEPVPHIDNHKQQCLYDEL